ncbi:hypothetical protein IWW39_000287 [Coemansia spiralis]|uniref:Uncharacterized protein n=1 Tax=Coemansia spiralis TaxID=417178 RepID=A0A9W8GSI7_9FUNG|nr:hypothetical protein IWW39_000287 [Coemansia spiralis]
MLIQGDGDKERAVAFKERYGRLVPDVAVVLERLRDVPIDIAPVWADINELREQYK